MNHTFGHKFASTYGVSAVAENSTGGRIQLTATARTWAAGLAGLTGEQIGNGLRICIASGGSWPPTLPEFVKMCKTKPSPKVYRAGIESDELKARRKEQYETGIAEIKKILTNGENNND